MHTQQLISASASCWYII